MSCGGCGGARQLIRAVAQGVRSIAAQAMGATPASEELVAARLRVCQDCAQRTHFANADWCGTPVLGNMLERGACGCLLALKARDPVQRCPQKKWPGEAAVDETVARGVGDDRVEVR